MEPCPSSHTPVTENQPNGITSHLPNNFINLIMMKQYLLFALLSWGITVSAQTKPDTLTNQSVIQLHNLGMSKEIIIAKIQGTLSSFDASTDALIALKKAGVADEVVTAMLTKNTATAATSGTAGQASGLYYVNPVTKAYVELEPTVLTNSKSGGVGNALMQGMTYGLANSKIKGTLSGKTSHALIAGNSPIFLFVFDANSKGGLGDNSAMFSSAQSPNEFLLLELKADKDSREIVVGKANITGSNSGFADDSKILFNAKKTKPGTYEVSFTTPLDPGEYCFMLAASPMNKGMANKVYDFSIKK